MLKSFLKIILNFIYLIYREILNIIPKFIYKYLIKFFNDLKNLTELKYYIKKDKYKLEIDNVSYYIYSRNLDIFSDEVPRAASKIPQTNWGEEYIYEYPVIKILQSIFKIEKKPIFMDIGAHQGYFTFFASKYLNDKYPVYGIESNKDYCKDLKVSIGLNNFLNCKIINEVLSDREKEMYIKTSSVNIPSKKSFLDNPELVKSKTLDNVVYENKIEPNILKIDVHGSEGPLIKGGHKTLINLVNFILLELHPPSYIHKYSPGYTRSMIIKDIIKLGFDCYAIGPFRTINTDEGANFIKHKKISHLKVTESNLEGILFDLSFGALFLAVKKDFEINKLDCLINKNIDEL